MVDTPTRDNKTISIFILIDALGWTYVKDRLFMAREASVRMPVRSILGFSSAAIPSILTGRMPDEHGHWSLFHRNGTGSPFRWSRAVRPVFRFMPERLARKIIEEISKRRYGYTGYFETYKVPLDILPDYDICEKHSIYMPGGLAPTRSIFDMWEESGVPYRVLSYNDGSDTELFKKAVDTVEAGDVRALFVYLAEMDAFLHGNCMNALAFDEKLSSYETMIRRLIIAANENYSDVRWFIFSDHGMTPTRKSVDLVGEMRRAGLEPGKEFFAFFDSTMARFWFNGADARCAVTASLAKIQDGRWLSGKEKAALGLRFKDDRYGEEIFLMNPGCVIAPSYMGHSAPAGMHGFHPNDDYSYAVFYSNVNDGYNTPKCITDFFDVMRRETFGNEAHERKG